jgi:uncharacterized membrane protein YdfJ with MMPL/SSD domain
MQQDDPRRRQIIDAALTLAATNGWRALSLAEIAKAAGVPLAEAYRSAVQFTGKVVALVGITLAAGVITWAFSPIKFQADMGILLTFMFVWNMIGALVLIPALSYFLLPTDVVRKRRASRLPAPEATLA